MEDHRLGDVSELHAVGAEEDVVFDRSGGGVVVGERGVVPHEVALAGDEDAASGKVETLLGLGAVLHAGPCNEGRQREHDISQTAFHRRTVFVSGSCGILRRTVG